MNLLEPLGDECALWHFNAIDFIDSGDPLSGFKCDMFQGFSVLVFMMGIKNPSTEPPVNPVAMTRRAAG